MRLKSSTWSIGALVILLALLAATRPWVVKPLDSTGRAIVGPVAFDPESFVAKVWSEQLPAKLSAAEPVEQAGDAAIFLKGEGVVMAVDTSSRVGVAQVDLDPQDGRADVDLQLGPVVTGSALRDALALRFADFDTQVDYANVGAALNRKALAGVPLLGEPSALKGRKITFAGAGAKAPTGRVRLLPVQVALTP